MKGWELMRFIWKFSLTLIVVILGMGCLRADHPSERMEECRQAGFPHSLTISHLDFRCPDSEGSGFVWGRQVCDGIRDCPGAEDEDCMSPSSVKQGPTSMSLQNKWNFDDPPSDSIVPLIVWPALNCKTPLCYDRPSPRDPMVAHLICKQLGFATFHRFGWNRRQDSKPAVGSENVQCLTGSERTIHECLTFPVLFNTTCEKFVTVSCQSTCTQTLNADSGVLFSPGYPYYSFPHLNCVWNLKSPDPTNVFVFTTMTATAIRRALERDLFQPDDERLVNFINVMRPGKKRKSYYLCLTITNQQPIVARLYQVKAEKAEVFRKKRTWLLRDVRQVDGINPRRPLPELKLQLGDKEFNWTVTNVKEKEPFIKHLYKLSTRYLPAQKPEFINVSIPVDEFAALAVGNEDSASTEPGEMAEEGGTEEYTPMSAKEEADFRRLLAKCHKTIGEADEFSIQLTSELSDLDGQNIQSIIGSEVAVNALMAQMEKAVEEAEQLENQLDQLDNLLQTVRESVDMMQEKDNVIGIESTNKRRLHDQLQQFLAGVDLSFENEQILRECNLSDLKKINHCSRAAQQLQRCLNAKVSPGMSHMKAYKDQVKKCTMLANDLAEKLVAHLTTLFQTLVDEGRTQWHSLELPKHSQRHHALLPFSELVIWLKSARPDAYKTLIDRYIAYMKELYKRELVDFFEGLKKEVKIQSLERRGSLKGVSIGDHKFTRQASVQQAGETSADAASDERVKFEKLLNTLLFELEPMVLAEQKFCVRFFHISSEIFSETETRSTGSADSTGAVDKKLEKQFNEQVRFVLGQLFKPLDSLLLEFISHCERANPHYLLFLLAKLSNHVLAKQETGSYIAVILGTAVVIVKRKFDTMMEKETQQLQESKLTKKTRIGVLENLRKFEELATEAEAAYKSSERRGDIDRWYQKMIAALTQAIETAAVDEYSKSPAPVVRMENYHKLYSTLSELKITALEGARKDAKTKYSASVSAYAKEHVGKPLDKMNNFFEQIGYSIEQGMRPEEVSYQQAYSKQELKKVISSYPGKEVKKGLDALYSKMEKHLSRDSSLLQVVWRFMQEEIVQQYKYYVELIGKCYPNSNMELEFSLKDILRYFSDIAQQH